jgi:hypothetical protein
MRNMDAESGTSASLAGGSMLRLYLPRQTPDPLQFLNSFNPGAAMPPSNSEMLALETVRRLEQTRIAAIRSNDAETMALILDNKFIYISSRGKIYDKQAYLTAVRSHGLTYSTDLDLTETDYRVDGDLVILVGLMRGHARLEREQDVYNDKNMRVWRERGREWKLLAWQSTATW